MAFDASDFDLGPSGCNDAPNIATYKTSDTFATVETDGYFDDERVYNKLVTGDVIRVYSSATDGGHRDYAATVTKASSDVAITPIGVCVQKTTITAAEMNTLAASPKTLVPAPGADKALIYHGGVGHFDGAAAFTATGGTQDLAVRYTDGSGQIVSTTVLGDADAFDLTDAAEKQAVFAALNGVDIDVIQNTPLVLDNVGAAELTGTGGVVTFYTFYSVLALPAV